MIAIRNYQCTQANSVYCGRFVRVNYIFYNSFSYQDFRKEIRYDIYFRIGYIAMMPRAQYQFECQKVLVYDTQS